MKLSVPRDSLSGALQLVGRAVSSRGTAALSRRHPPRRVERVLLTLRATDMRARADAHARRREGRGRGIGRCCPGRLLVDVVRSLPAGEVTLELRTRGAGRRDRGRQRPLPPADAAGRGLPAAARVRGRDREAARRAAGRDRSTASPARRRATRSARSSPACWSQAEGETADDGRHRLLPPQRQAHRARGTGRAAARGERPGAGAARARPDHRAGGRRGGRDRAAPQPDHLPRRRRDPVLAADRGPVPELPPAPAGDVRARGPAAARRSSSRSPAGSASSRSATRRCASPSPRAS